MIVQTFTFNDFQENTYILYDDSKECAIIDPGCNTLAEQKTLTDFVDYHRLTPKYLINTHCHIDHILGNNFIRKTYGLQLHAHRGESVVLDHGTQVAMMYGISYDISPPIQHFLEEGDTVELGYSKLDILLTPGHSPASICLYNKAQNTVIAGDVLFLGSIGRTDLPGGDFDTLITSIKQKLFILPPHTLVYPGHGEPTTIHHEMHTNPFFT